MNNTISWNSCIETLIGIFSDDEINTWLRPLHGSTDKNTLKLLAPNRYVLTYVKANLLAQMENALISANPDIHRVQIDIGSYATESPAAEPNHTHKETKQPYCGGALNSDYTFNTHVDGKSNQLARAAALQVGGNPGCAYNPLFIYGDVGLGKTHLMQATGNMMLEHNPRARVVYVHSEMFVNDMVKALKNNTMNEFKRYYRSIDALLIDDIQFFAKKTQSQEEFFHTFNALLEGQRQIIITSDRIPNAINNIAERLISRFGSGLTVSIEPPELETRVAILEKKALKEGIHFPNDVAFFVANTVRNNVRELEGALCRIIANASFTGRSVDIELARESLRDILVYQETRFSIDNIQQTVAAYYKIRVSDLLSKKRTREITRPRQHAMLFAKEFTNLSLPQIGDRFGGRDHTTVIHACKKVDELIQSDYKMKEDHCNLQRLFGG